MPSHWPLEVLNGIVMGKLRGRISDNERQRFLDSLSSFNKLIDEGPALSRFEAIRKLAESHKLTAYDAAYLELALRRRLPLATLDRALRAAALLEQVHLL